MNKCHFIAIYILGGWTIHFCKLILLFQNRKYCENNEPILTVIQKKKYLINKKTSTTTTRISDSLATRYQHVYLPRILKVMHQTYIFFFNVSNTNFWFSPHFFFNILYYFLLSSLKVQLLTKAYSCLSLFFFLLFFSK